MLPTLIPDGSPDRPTHRTEQLTNNIVPEASRKAGVNSLQMSSTSDLHHRRILEHIHIPIHIRNPVIMVSVNLLTQTTTEPKI